MTEEAEQTDGEVLLVGSYALLAVWGLFYPRPYWLCINCLAVAPWVAMAIRGYSGRSVGLLGLWEDKTQQPNIATSAAVPGTLGLRAVLDTDVLDPLPALAVAAAVAIAFAAAFLMVCRRSDVEWAWKVHPLGLCAFLGFVGMLYGWGLVVEANVIYDRGAPTTTPMLVREKNEISRPGRFRYLTVVRADGSGVEERVGVTAHDYASTAVGRIVCVFDHPGTFGIGWREAGACPAASRP